MNYNYLFLFVGLILIGCTQNEEITFETKEFSEAMLSICDFDPCSTVQLTYPEAIVEDVDKNTTAVHINRAIKNHITQFLFLGEDVPTAQVHIEAAATDFILAYRDHQADIPPEIDNGGYVATLDMIVLKNNPHLICIESNSYLETGGAHGIGNVTYLNFDPKTGNVLDIESLITDFEAFTKVVEQEFRKSKNIPHHSSLNKEGFWFDEDKFYVSNNVGFIKDTMMVFYNTYEINSYGAGATELIIPWEKVSKYFEKPILE